MSVHTIKMPDWMRGRELRTVVWDDEAGTVTGDHSEVPWLQETLAREMPLDLGTEGGNFIVTDPAHDPADFLAVLGRAYWPILDHDRDRHLLSDSLRDVESTRATPWPDQYETMPGGTRRKLVDGVDFLY